MRDIPQNVPFAPASVLGIGTRVMQLGLDEFQNALGLQLKCIERDRVAVQRACHALLEARAYDPVAFLQTWQTLVRDYFAASAALCEQSQDLATRSQAAFSALLRDAALDFEKACGQAQAQVQTAYPTPAIPQPADWMTYLGQFMGVRPNGEATPQSRSASAGA